MASQGQSAATSSTMEEVTGILPPPTLPAEAKGEAPGRGRLTGRHILMVGGGQSINSFDPNPPVGNGRACCVLMAREGATVVVADRSREAAQSTADIIEKEGVGRAFVVVADVSTPEGCSSVVQDSLKALGGKLDGLVLGVGIVSAGPSVPKNGLENWDLVMDINVRSHFLIMQEAGPYMEKLPGGGAIVSISSVAAHLAASPEVPYHASKAALLVLVRNAAYQFAPKVRVNSVCPGLIDTPMGRTSGLTIKGRNASAIPLSRQGTGWDIAYMVTFLMSGESSFITAQDFVVDGGRVGTNQGAKKINQEVGVS